MPAAQFPARLSRLPDKRGIATSFAYDAMDRLVTVSKAGVQLSRNQYDGNGNLLASTDANGNTTSYTYDKRNLRLMESRLLAAITRFTRDSMGDALTVTDPEGRVTVNAYDARRRLLSVANGAGESTSYRYDGANNRTGSTRPGGGVTTVAYDAAGRVSSITDPVSTTGYAYDSNSNHTALTDERGNVTRYSYDALKRRTGISYPGGAAESFAYDAAGNLLAHTDGNGVVISHAYDVLNRETSRAYSASDDGLSSILTGYDANNNIVSVTQNGATTQVSSYAFDSFDRQQRHTDPFGAVASTSYDANGNKTALITQDGKVSRYAYDALNRLTSIVGQSGTVSYGYDRSSLNTGISHSNGVSSSMAYDLARRTTRVVHAKGGANLSLTQYDYDVNGNRTGETINRTAGAQVTSYGYDSADRLVHTSVVEASQSVATDYTLDAVANRVGETITTVTGGASSTVSRGYQYDGRNQLTGISDAAAGDTVLSYDAQGNLTQKQQGSDQVAYRYDARDHLISVARNGAVLGRYGNDHLGLRVEKEAMDPLQPGAPPVRLRTLWDGRDAFLDSSAAGVVARYDSDGRHSVGMWSKDDGVQALHHDALGSIVATTDSDGALKSETIYDAWGNVRQATGQSTNKFGYTGHQMDKESGLIYFQARYYDPAIGRFITQDPFEGDRQTPLSLHHYLYAYGNPTTYVDLDGYASVSTMIDDAAAGCGAVSCAGWALLKGTYVAGTLGFASVFDPFRDAYDAGKINQKQLLVGSTGAAVVATVNMAAMVFTGGTASPAVAALGTTLVSRLVNAAGTGMAVGLANDSLTQATNVAGGMQERYNPNQGVVTGVAGGAIGVGSAAAVEGFIAAKNAIAATRARTSAPGVASKTEAIADAKLTTEGGQKEIAVATPSTGASSAGASAEAAASTGRQQFLVIMISLAQ
jgi:RHS repeat-associated protein